MPDAAQARDELHGALTELVALFGTAELRRYSLFDKCVHALALSVNSGCRRPVTLAHAQDVWDKAAALKAAD